MFELHGKVALVTGGGGARVGTGAGIALALARQGAAVAVNDRKPDAAARTVAEIEAIGGRAFCIPFDVRDEAAVREGVAAAVAALGPIDILVNSAGMGPQTPFLDLDPEMYEKTIALNLFGTVYCTRAVLGGMRERGWGRVIMISSISAFSGSSIGLTAYAAGKAGVLGFMRQLAVEVAPHGVTVNAVAPGFVTSPPAPGTDPKAHPRGANIPVGRPGTPDDVGTVCVFLASNEAEWFTGQTMHPNGGSFTT